MSIDSFAPRVPMDMDPRSGQPWVSMPRTCASCGHFDAKTSTCRFQPPAIGKADFARGMHVHPAVWPNVHPSLDWCSRHTMLADDPSTTTTTGGTS